MTNIAEHLWLHGRDQPDRIALRGPETDWSYGDLRDHISAIAGGLRAHGVGVGDRVVLVVPSVPEFAAAYYGLLGAGATVVAMNPMATARELDYVLRDAQCTLVIAWHASAVAATVAAADNGVELFTLAPGAEGMPVGGPIPAPHPCSDTDTAVVLYTSGTTGQPKGAELTHGNLRAAARITGRLVAARPEDAFGTALPLFHVYGGSVLMGCVLLHGASLSLLPAFNSSAAQEMVVRDQLSVFAGVPTMYNAMLNDSAGLSELSCLRLCLSGGASLPDEVLREFDERFGIVILEGYGMTESTGVGTFNGLHRLRKPGFVGPASPETDVRIVDEDGRELAPGEVGEVNLRGPTLMKGYLGRPEATAETIRGDWLFTGDLGAIDDDGDVRIIDRKKDLIVHGGYNVYPREVEEVLYEHPDILEAAVIGVQDRHYGEQVAAVVALRPGAALDADCLRAWTKQRLSAYKAPRLFRFVDSLPKGATGKILKRSIARDDFVSAARGDAAGRS